MKLSKFIIALIIVSFYISSDIYAKGPEILGNYSKPVLTGWRNACVRPTKTIDMEINNVRARLKTGGDIWNINADNGGYIVPKPAPGQPAVSALYAGGVWIGGVDRAQQIKLRTSSRLLCRLLKTSSSGVLSRSNPSTYPPRTPRGPRSLRPSWKMF